MKSILFLMRYPLEEKYNLKQKFDGQMQSVVSLGYTVYHFAYDKKCIYLVNVNTGEKKKIAATTCGSLGNYRSTFGFFDLFGCFKKVLKTHKFDVVYMRQKFIIGDALPAFKAYKKSGGKVIVEIPSYGSVEQSLSLSRTVAKKLFGLLDKQFEKYVDLYTIIGTDTLKEYKGKKAVCIANGVCVEKYPLNKKRQNDEIHILALASMRDWHGFDRLVTGLAEYSGETPVYIEMVGNDGDGSLEKWKSLSNELGVADFVNFHGGKYGTELDEIIDMCDIGAATLALHRNLECKTASVLKVREYAARGIPFICAYNDSALDGSEPFVLQIPHDDSPVDIAAVVAWTMDLYKKENFKKEIRAFADKNMSWKTQFEKILNC